MTGRKLAVACIIWLSFLSCSDSGGIASFDGSGKVDMIPKGVFEAFYEDWFWSDNRTSVAATKYFVNMTQTRRTLPTFGGFVFDGDWNFQFMVIGSWFREVDHDLKPLGPEIFEIDTLESLYAQVTVSSDDYTEGSYGLVFKSYGTRTHADIEKRIRKWLSHNKASKGHGASGFLLTSSKDPGQRH